MSRATGKIKKLKELTDQVLYAISHPVRIEIQCILFNRTASPNEIAKELGEGLGKISHHVEVLTKEGTIRLVDTKQRRGAVEHFYRAVLPPTHSDAAWAKLPKATRVSITAVTLRGLIGETVRAVVHDTFDARKDRHLSRIPMLLDDEGWQKLVGSQTRWLEEAEEIKAEAAERLGASGEDGRRFFVGIVGIETPAGLGMTDRGEKSE